MTTTYLSYLTFERNFGRPLGPVDTSVADQDADLVAEEAYFRANIGRVSTGAELVADDRLYQYALTAFGLTDQVDNRELIVDVLNEGILNPFDPNRRTPTPANAIDAAARDFYFDQSLVFSFEIDAQVDRTINRFIARTGNNPLAAQDDITYFRDNIRLVNSGQALIENPRLRDFVFVAYDLTEELGNQELVAQALDAGTYNPAASTPKEDALANTLRDSRFRTLAQAFAFNELGDLNTQNTTFVSTIVDRYNEAVLTTRAREAQEIGREAPIQSFDQREIEYFRENIGDISSAEELLANDRLFRFAVTAYDLESQISSRALIGRALEEGIEDEDALANQLVDRRFREFAAAFGFAEVGDRNVRNPNFVEEVIENFTRVRVETDAGEDNVGVRLAAYFDRQAGNFTSFFDILGDRALREVVFTALDLPNELQGTDPDRLAEIFEQRLDLDELNDPAGRAEFIERFTVLYDIRNGAPSAGANILSLFPGGGAGPVNDGVVAIDPSTLSATLF